MKIMKHILDETIFIDENRMIRDQLKHLPKLGLYLPDFDRIMRESKELCYRQDSSDGIYFLKKKTFIFYIPRCRRYIFLSNGAQIMTSIGGQCTQVPGMKTQYLESNN